MLKLFALGVAGAAGTLARYWLSGLVQRYSREGVPLGTLVINVVGCFLVGVIMYMVNEQQRFTPETRVFLTVGLLGGFTTFSAFGYETLQLIRNGAILLAALSVCGNVLVGTCAVWFGSVAGRILAL